MELLEVLLILHTCSVRRCIIIELPAPIKGISKGFPVDKEDSLHSGYMNNVRPTDVLENRIRLGQRPGLEKWGAGVQVGAAENPIVAYAVVSAVS